MARLMLGLPSLKGKLANYADKYNLVELAPVDTPLPKPKKLAVWREQVPPSFAFSVVLPRIVATLKPSDAFDDALSVSLEAATALQASCIVLHTPASVRPTNRNRERVAQLRERLPKDGHVLAWHAAGIWEAEDFMATAQAAGWLPVFDAAQEPLPPGPVVYTRIRAIGHASQMGHQRIAQVAHQLAGRREAYVIVDPQLAKRMKSGISAALEDMPARRKVPSLFKPNAGALGVDEAQ